MKKPEISIAKPAIKNVGPVQFIRQSINELKKVTWPSRSQTIKLTAIVMGVSIAVGLYIGMLDYLFTNLTSTLLK
jgi:preprotein translocase subunit SecE